MVKSEDCWDGVNSMAYSGKVAVTASGIECQAWSMDEPHSHGCHDPVNFPHDGSDVAAQNYCRDIILSLEGFPWCYTMSNRRWEGCDIPICFSKSFQN
ncbi:plasminogen-like isoform X2 [Mya arenaria]|uniref:plasminogen-like isoform X2 n=1 Tax=Mya arenaria TaxID=6604 RepID=UPI0022E1F608|nr:plasminogen-like isoform X2 [Mya arenaria]